MIRTRWIRAAVLAAVGMAAGAATGLAVVGGASDDRDAATAAEAGTDAAAYGQADSPIDVCDASCIRNRGVAALIVLNMGH